MDDRIYHIRISPEVVLNDVFKVNIYSPYIDTELVPFCCDILTREVTKFVTGSTYVYSSMTDLPYLVWNLSCDKFSIPLFVKYKFTLCFPFFNSNHSY